MKPADADIGRLHHVGHVVADMAAALSLYRQLGFAVPVPSYPAMVRRDGSEPEPFGATNTHADFARNFVELATYVSDGATAQIPAGARLVPLEAPPDVLPTLLERIEATSAGLAAHLDRFEGLHILMFSSPDVDAAAARLTACGIRNGGVNELRRPVEVNGETLVEAVRYLELDDVPEGRVGVVADLGPESVNLRRTSMHPNGAIDLVDVLLCMADDELSGVRRRYEGYLDRPARQVDPAYVFQLGDGTVTLVGESGLGNLLPGERAPAVPALVAYTVGVGDLGATEELLRTGGFPVQRMPTGGSFVPAAAALGAAVCFRPVR